MSKNPLKIPCDKCGGKPTYIGTIAPGDAEACEFFAVIPGVSVPYVSAVELMGIHYYWKLTKYKGQRLCRDCLCPSWSLDDENMGRLFDKCNVSAYSNNYQGGVFQ